MSFRSKEKIMSGFDEAAAQVLGVDFTVYTVAKVDTDWYLTPGSHLLTGATSVEDAQTAAETYLGKTPVGRWVYRGNDEVGSKAMFL
jgi:hypothetical protein